MLNLYYAIYTFFTHSSKLTPSSSKRAGFTIVELLIVVIVIAILATISLVSFGAIQNRAHDSAVQTDLRQLGQRIQQYSVERNGAYPTATILVSEGLSDHRFSKDSYGNHFSSGVNKYNLLYCRDTAKPGYALFAASKSGKAFRYVDGAMTEIPALQGSAPACASVGVSE